MTYKSVDELKKWNKMVYICGPRDYPKNPKGI